MRPFRWASLLPRLLIPVEHSSTPNCINSPFVVNGICYNVTALSFGSPHGGVLVDGVDSVDVASIGSALGTHVLFPEAACVAATVSVSMMLQKIMLYKASVLMGGTTFKVE